ncbi:MAG TPA: class I SAM-dependent methyltransferase [Polyangiaceae bacterium]|nr:class I SAM-dependent methyltransferase [Polyangiaceae bacterium]
MKYFDRDSETATEAKIRAQTLSFAPIAFQAARLLRDFEILSTVRQAGKSGIALSDLQGKIDLPAYGVKVLAEAGLGIGLLYLSDGNFFLTKAGYFVMHDAQTRVNMDFTHHICYRGMFDLEQAIRAGQPVGLASLGDWPTVYHGVSVLPPQAKQSWLAFDHFYSDLAFPKALPLVFQHHPKRLLDVGGNTGKWAMQCATYDPDVHVTIVDLPGQLAMMQANVAQHGLSHRIDGYALDLLDPNKPFPKGYDVIWMSQFLDCFSLEQVVNILQRAAAAMDETSRLFILEPYWDRQGNPTAAYCVQQTSLYFTCIANGNSQLYHSDDMTRSLAAAGLEIIEEADEIGPSHTLTQCRLKSPST